MATFYFNGAADIAAELPPDWQTLGNWWMSYNAETNTHSVPATALPTSTDDIEVRGNISGNSGSEPTVANASFFGSGSNSISITINGNCTFNDGSYNSGTITGDCTFNDSSGTGGGGTITGDCTFNDYSYHFGYITGDCVFNDNSYNHWGTITGNCTFNDSSGTGGTINGACNFNNSSIANYTTITGDCTFNDSSYAYYTTITGVARFRPSSAGVMITGGYAGTYGSVEIIYDKGINGSSILGVI